MAASKLIFTERDRSCGLKYYLIVYAKTVSNYICTGRQIENAVILNSEILNFRTLTFF